MKEASDDSDVVLGGFTLSKKEEIDSVKGGSVNYQSPEILQQSNINTKSDMWSFGVCCFLFLTGKLPFQDNNRMKRNLKISKANYTIDTPISDSAKNFVSSFLCADQNNRSSASDALKHKWITEKASETQLENVRSLFSKIN